MRVLLFSPRLRLFRGFIDYPYYQHLNTLTTAGALRSAGHDVAVLDQLFHDRTGLWDLDERYWGFGFPLDDLKEELPEGPFDAVVVMNSPFTNLQRRDAELKAALERLSAHYGNPPLVLADGYIGGQHRVDVVDEKVLAAYGFHGYAKDESESVLSPLLEEVTAQTPGAPLIRQGTPETIPHPAAVQLTPQQVATQRSIVNYFFKITRRQPDFGETGLTLGTHTSRGCVYACSFCTSNPSGDPKSFRPFDMDALKTYWASIKDSVGLERLVILDELANGQVRHFENLLSAAEELDVELSFPNGLRADRLTREHIARLAKRCPRLSVSAESAATDIRQGAIGKRLAPGKIRQTAQWCHEEGLPLLIHYMVGYPQETVENLNETFSESLELAEQFGADPSMQFAVPLPGARLHAELKEKGLLTETDVGDYLPYFHTGGLIEMEHFTAQELREAVHWYRVKKRSLVPEKVIMNLTYVCNNQCTFCATGNRFKGHADLEYYQKLLRDHYAKGIRLVDFDGGEPTLYPHFLDVLGYARELGYDKVNLTTNGRLMAYEKMARKILASGVTELLISFHGHNAHYHEHQTQAPGSYEQTLGGIKNALKLGANQRLRFGVNFTLTAHNAPDMVDYVGFVKDLGVNRVNIQFVTPFGRAHPEDIPDPADAVPHVREALDRYGGAMDIQIINLPFCFLPGHERHLTGDVAKAARTMVFVSEQEVNLAKFLEVTRKKTEVCTHCRFNVACDGFYDFDRAESVSGAVPLNTAQVGGRG